MTTQTVTTLRSLFVHNDWARERVMEAVLPITDEQLDRAFEMGPGSLRRTLQHMWRAERWWLDRWQGVGDQAADPSKSDLSPAQIHERFRETAKDRDGFLDGLGEAGESQRLPWTDHGGVSHAWPLGDMMLHVCNHAIHHRAQAVNMIRRLDAKPPDIDLIYMKMDPSPQPATAFDRDTIAEYYRYQDWAREIVLGIAEGLSNDQLDRPVEIGLGSLRKVLLHVRAAEQWWLLNWSGRPPEVYRDLGEDTSIAELRKLHDETAASRNQLLAKQTNKDLQRTVTARPRPDVELTFSLGDAMLQMCGHGTHHRAQILNMFRQHDAEVPSLDYADWLRAC